jgi:hypothetical protein
MGNEICGNLNEESMRPLAECIKGTVSYHYGLQKTWHCVPSCGFETKVNTSSLSDRTQSRDAMFCQ